MTRTLLTIRDIIPKILLQVANLFIIKSNKQTINRFL